MYFSHMQGGGGFWHHFTSFYELHASEWATSMHPYLHCKCKSAFADVDVGRVALP